MPELLRIQTKHFQFSVWCNDITKRLHAHQATIERRKNTDSDERQEKPHLINLSPPGLAKNATLMGQPVDLTDHSTGNLPMTEPLFFENTQYQFEWIFVDQASGTNEARLVHRNRLINESFRFSAADGPIPPRVNGVINTGNDVGWMHLPLEYLIDGKIFQSIIAFEVLPTKMDLHTDLPPMYEAIDKSFPLWRFSLTEKTEQTAAHSQHRGYFPLLWLANFSSLRDRLTQGLKVIAHAPHNRLQPEVHYLKADRLKGRLSHRLASRVKEGLTSGQFDRRYKVEKKLLSIDTPENRFIKMVVVQSANRLAEFEVKLRKSNKTPDNQRLSTAFFEQIHSWQQPLRKMQNQSFLKDVGVYHGLTNESLVLQQKTGYSTVYRIWQELKFYLDVFGAQSSVSMKSVAEIYEVWCFLELRNILIEELGFRDISHGHRKLKLNDYYEYQMQDGFAGAFEFEREDGVTAKLAHEPFFSKRGMFIRSYLVNQKPDIVLEVQQPNPSGKSFIWVFDAKYRIKSDTDRYGDEKLDDRNMVPDDAINQMHRYRDALIRVAKGQHYSVLNKTRPVVGAFALYPGYYDQRNEDNPYNEGIAEVGIGAFAMLPDSNGSTGTLWLTEFLRDQIGTKSPLPATYQAKSFTEHLYISESARIPYHGMTQLFYPDLTFAVALGHRTGRGAGYFEAFKDGTARWYHIPQKTFLNKYRQHIAEEIRFLALASDAEERTGSKKIDKIWPVKNVNLILRKNISAEESGAESDSTELYYLFELGKPLKLMTPVINVPGGSFRASMKLTRLSMLDVADEFSDLDTVYDDALI
jgi:hypothetical protein